MICGVCSAAPAAFQVVAVDAIDETCVEVGDPYWLGVCDDCRDEIEVVTVTVRPLGSRLAPQASQGAQNRRAE